MFILRMTSIHDASWRLYAITIAKWGQGNPHCLLWVLPNLWPPSFMFSSSSRASFKQYLLLKYIRIRSGPSKVGHYTLWERWTSSCLAIHFWLYWLKGIFFNLRIWNHKPSPCEEWIILADIGQTSASKGSLGNFNFNLRLKFFIQNVWGEQTQSESLSPYRSPKISNIYMKKITLYIQGQSTYQYIRCSVLTMSVLANRNVTWQCGRAANPVSVQFFKWWPGGGVVLMATRHLSRLSRQMKSDMKLIPLNLMPRNRHCKNIPTSNTYVWTQTRNVEKPSLLRFFSSDIHFGQHWKH